MKRLVRFLTICLILVIRIECDLLQIDDLREVVADESIRNELSVLHKNQELSRQEIKTKVEAILKRLPANVQDAYKKLLRGKEMQEEAKYELKVVELMNQGAPQKKIDAHKQARLIELDLSLSKKNKKAQIRELKPKKH